MGNSLSGKKRIIKVMKVDGTALKLKPPAQAESVLKDHKGHNLFEAEEVKRLGLQARPLHPEAPLLAGKIYFLVELPRVPDQRVPRRAWSGALNLSAKERLESLRLARRSMSDIARSSSDATVEAEEAKDGSVRLKMRLPRAQVERLVQESKDAGEVAEKIMKLCAAAKEQKVSPGPTMPTARTGGKEKRARFAEMPDEIIAY
ncbi:hypothetical protein Cni_G02994 [Canna indica]|uniref:Plastid movement impaired 2 n=1 Tax=Canna indica TaxID=4628 RepID=A0AAQ3JSE5_9LILI|nr:hypothetical protein Cni_G02994 [Canna indica]